VFWSFKPGAGTFFAAINYMKKVVAIDARPLAKLHDGISRYLWELIAHLSEQPEFQLLLISNKPLADRPLARHVERVDDAAWRSCPGSLWYALRFAALVQRHGADLVWGPQHVLPPVGLGDTPCVLTMHDLVHKRFPETMARHNLLISNLLIARSLRRADAVVCISRFTREEVRAFYPDLPDARLHVQHNGRTVLPAAEPTAVALPERFLFCLGSLEPRKNLMQVVRAFAELRRSIPDLRLVLAGGASWKDSAVWDCIAELGQQEFVVFLGRISDGQIRHCLERCEALVFASVYEGFGLPVLEAAGIARRIVLNDIPVLREVAPYAPGVALVDFSRPAVASAGIAALLDGTRPPDVASLVPPSWGDVSQGYARLFHDLLGNPGDRAKNDGR